MYKTILVHVDQSPRSAVRTDIAARLAALHDAHLVGGAVTGLASYLFPQTGLDPGTPAIAFPIAELHAEADRVLDLFDQRASRAGVNSFERRRIDDEAGAGISTHARYCDLVVISQSAYDEFTPRLRTDFPEYVVLNCARPVLVVPAKGAIGEVGTRITVAWNGSSNAVRAITSAIPMLQRAQAVNLVVLNSEGGDQHGDTPGADIALYLARHGIRVDVTAAQAGGDAGESLLSLAADQGADLIVMGAYGHSRFSEILLGGASRTALLTSPIPLWMAH
ncbi:universal stress protein [Massilia sp. TSP1-1-2]|uniref:universal stress protein n=1 Tax=Massilia sp. TSP1-1-2 TaxID=2804649 RepID=UPI003CE68DFF